MALKVLVLPDTQCRPGRSLRSLTWVQRFIDDKCPDVVVHLGDHWDFPSLSSYDRGKKSAEGKRVSADWKAGCEGVERLMAGKHKPRWVFTEGNHENRLTRHEEDNPALDSLPKPVQYLRGLGWDAYPFLRVVTIGGVNFSHIFPRATTGRVTAASARNGPSTALSMIKANMASCVMGHRQGLDMAVYHAGHRTYYGLIAGSYYEGQESYLTPQYTNYWRGVCLLHQVRNGTFDPCFVSLNYLRSRYGSKS